MSSNINQNLTVRLLAENRTAAAFNSLNQSLSNLKRQVLGAAAALAGGLAFKDIIDSTRSWGNEVDRLADFFGLAATEASKLNFIAKAQS
mgnify:CR=1 FL=1